LTVDTIVGDLLPEQKMQFVQKRQSQGEIVAMLGDGVNDAPVIAQADVSVAMANGSELSHAQADIIVLHGQLDGLSALHRIAVKTKRIARQNMFWAVVYNFVAIPLAATGLLTPWLAALGMSASSLLVVLNALRVKIKQ
jgi:Cu2+-exporting ATPase